MDDRWIDFTFVGKFFSEARQWGGNFLYFPRTPVHPQLPADPRTNLLSQSWPAMRHETRSLPTKWRRDKLWSATIWSVSTTRKMSYSLITRRSVAWVVVISRPSKFNTWHLAISASMLTNGKHHHYHSLGFIQFRALILTLTGVPTRGLRISRTGC